MSEDDMMLPILTAAMVPTAWACTCPMCGAMVEVPEVGDDDAGVFFAVDEHCVVQCDDCGAVIAPKGARIVEVDDAPYRSGR